MKRGGVYNTDDEKAGGTAYGLRLHSHSSRGLEFRAMRRFKFSLAALLICLVCAVSHAQHQTQTYLRDDPAQHKGDSVPFDTSATKLPPDYQGTNLEALRAAISSRLRRFEKDEFETTAQYQERVRLEEARPLFGQLTRESLLAAVEPATASYDADREVMSVAIKIPIYSSVILMTGAERTYTADVKMDIPTARRAKPELRALIVFKLAPPYVSDGRLNADVQEVWFYNNSTGEVYAKQRKADEVGESAVAVAERLFKEGKDDEALAELRDVVRAYPMNARAYLLTGKIYYRRGELAAAVSQLKTSIFWDADRRLIDAHLLLGRIFLERGDRVQAAAYVRSAVQIDPNNQEALALQRQLQAGRQ